ncbi:S-adenosyl-L-methionine-dependent methyltransferase [Chlamydoabsidia padenii]|nr:S-adenosyl-L-methionine-dependent methyltransferase [Chlamydoabsidia padenii]
MDLNHPSFHDQSTLQLYSSYAGILTLEELLTHLQNIQQKLKKTDTSYRCIDHYKFATSRMNRRFFYSNILEFGKRWQDPFLIDIGCCTGTDLRQLYLDGYPKDYLIGLDTSSHYIDCGYDLFKDRSRCPLTFLVGDVFTDDNNDGIQAYEGRAAIVMTGSVIHLFQEQDQVIQFVTRMTRLLRPGGLFVGAHVAMLNSGTVDRQQEDDRQWTRKFYLGQHEFESILTRYGFVDIQMETEPRIPFFDQEQCLPVSSNQLFWLSFSATYST